RCDGHRRTRPSFPTRRSSDLAHRVQAAPEPPPAFASVHEEARRLAQRWPGAVVEDKGAALGLHWRGAPAAGDALRDFADAALPRSEEHTSELQSRENLVCRLL